MKILGSRSGRSQLLPLLASYDSEDPRESRSSFAFDTPTLDAFTPPDAQDSIFPHLQGAGSFQMRLLPKLGRGGICGRVRRRKVRKGGADQKEEDLTTANMKIRGGDTMTTTRLISPPCARRCCYFYCSRLPCRLPPFGDAVD